MSEYSKDRIIKLQKLVHKELPSSDSQYDSDDDMYHHPFKPNERVDFLDQNDNWSTGHVEIALEEMIKC